MLLTSGRTLYTTTPMKVNIRQYPNPFFSISMPPLLLSIFCLYVSCFTSVILTNPSRKYFIINLFSTVNYVCFSFSIKHVPHLYSLPTLSSLFCSTCVVEEAIMKGGDGPNAPLYIKCNSDGYFCLMYYSTLNQFICLYFAILRMYFFNYEI